MFNTDDVSRIKNTVSSLTKQTSGDVEVNYGEGLHVTLDNGRAVITAEDKNALARGFFMLSKAIAQKQDKLDLHQARHFSSCGAMIDMSRNAVMTVNAVKGVIDKMAALGMNLLMLYTEDTYTVPGYPYLGYLRGRYSRAELTEIDAYAASFDIEVVPCIQTLGHMEQFLQWSANSAMEDQPAILLAGARETYEFIEAAVSELRSCMRAKRIHIGMDEAHGVGLGQYYIKHGARDRFEILNSHLARVCEICKKHGFHPIMWSDMFFRLGSKNNDYFDLEADIPESVIKMIPDVDLCYWDYYHTDEALYNHMMEQHAKMGKTVFAGGIWTWSGFLPHVKRTEATMLPALKACIRHSVDTVFATMWGDDGAETDFCLAFNQLPLFSEFCWQGEAAAVDDIRETGAFLTGISAEDYRTFGEFI